MQYADQRDGETIVDVSPLLAEGGAVRCLSNAAKVMTVPLPLCVFEFLGLC